MNIALHSWRALVAGILMVAGLSVAGSAARAETEAQKRTATTAANWGLVAIWRIDCSTPASRNNGSLGYAIRNGVLMHERDFGDARDTQEVLQANPQPNGGLELVVHFPGFQQTRKYVMIKAGPRIRAVANSLADGTSPTIRDGKFVHNGAETPWQQRCGTNDASSSSGAAPQMSR